MNIRKAPGRRIILLHAESKKEAIAATKLMLRHLEETCSEDGKTVQSIYEENGVIWFG